MPNRDPLVNKLKLINKPKVGDLKNMQQVGCLAESLWWSGSSHHDEMHLYFISLCAVTSQLLAKTHQASLAESSGHEAW